MKLAWISVYLVSVTAAWFLGTRSRVDDEDKPRKTKVPRDYLQGLNFLLNEETDKAVDLFIKMLEVDSDTVETHLAVGKLFRKRGEVDRALRIHQNLIARPQLEKVYREQSLFELGHDYLSAGMLDRAEKVFHELVDAKSHSASALSILMDIYEQEKDWEQAIEIAKKYESITRKNLRPNIAHYYCELAEIQFNQGHLEKAREYTDKALSMDDDCVRASLLQANIFVQEYEYKAALKSLKKIKNQNANYLSESIELVATCYEKLDDEKGLVIYFKKLLEEFPRLPVVLILAERIRKWKGDKVATNFAADYVRRYPSLRGLHSFINIYIASAEGRAKEDLTILQNLMKKVLANKPEFRCSACGFAGKNLHWQCPSCKQWNTMLPSHTWEEELA